VRLRGGKAAVVGGEVVLSCPVLGGEMGRRLGQFGGEDGGSGEIGRWLGN